ncbi:MAG: TatD family hydrolase [Candidatus Eremiobacteraeota bacterium]|nr:TatD family hydrolase [Candidatus Eremiobacteraeota bacterium]
MRLADTHAHLDGPAFADDLGAVLERAATVGVRAIVSAGQDEATSRETLRLAREYPIIAPAVGVHPHEARTAGDMSWLGTMLDDPAVVAAGEMGLDYHYDHCPRDVQRDVLGRQLDMAAQRDLPVILHCREAQDDLIAVLRDRFARGRLGVVHCFTGSYADGMRLIDEFGLYLGIGGAVTFKKAIELHDAAARLPLEQLVLETDCPFMTPAPHRGKRNEPANISLTCLRVAELRGAGAIAIAEATSANAARLFPKLTVPA